MKLDFIVENLKLKILSAHDRMGIEVAGGYTSDLLSDVIANSQEGSLWITLQIHSNIIAVAGLKDLAGIIIVRNRMPDAETIKKAMDKQVPLLISEETAYEVSGKLYQLLKSEE